MSMNEGIADRVVRVALGIVLMSLGFGGVIDGTVGTVVGIVGLVPLLTGLVGWCPLYTVMGMSTKKNDASTAGAK